MSSEKVSSIKPSQKDGFVTEASSCAFADGAAGLMLASSTFDNSIAKPLAKIIAYSEAGCDPGEFLQAVVPAAQLALSKAGLKVDEIDLWEVHETFAFVPLFFMREMGIGKEKVNVFGGAVALGHPMGCTGARIVNTLVSALTVRKKKLGVAVMCNGGGGACGLVIEML
jgi:acetyl-CoA C-acetyltransferase